MAYSIQGGGNMKKKDHLIVIWNHNVQNRVKEWKLIRWVNKHARNKIIQMLWVRKEY